MSTCGGGSGSSSGSGASDEPIDEQIREFISSKITCNILEQGPVIFGIIKEGILEVLDKRLDSCLETFDIEMLAVVRDRTLTFWGFCACGAPEFFGVRHPIISRRWITDMESA